MLVAVHDVLVGVVIEHQAVDEGQDGQWELGQGVRMAAVAEQAENAEVPGEVVVFGNAVGIVEPVGTAGTVIQGIVVFVLLPVQAVVAEV